MQQAVSKLQGLRINSKAPASGAGKDPTAITTAAGGGDTGTGTGDSSAKTKTSWQTRALRG